MPIAPRTLWRTARVAGSLGWQLPAWHLARGTGARVLRVRAFLGTAGRLFGLDVRVVGTPLARDVLFVANHVSWLDILAIGGATGAAFVSKDDVARWPLVGHLARIGGTIFIRRTARGRVREQADTLRAALVRGRPVALFPEGETGDGIALLPFRAALLDAVFPPPRGLRVQPVALDYGPAAREIAWAGEEGAPSNFKRVSRRPGRLPLTLCFLAPLDPADYTDRKALAAAARTAIAEALGRA